MDRNIQPWAWHGKKGFCFKLFLQNSSNWNPDLIRVNQSDTTQGPGRVTVVTFGQNKLMLYMYMQDASASELLI